MAMEHAEGKKFNPLNLFLMLILWIGIFAIGITLIIIIINALHTGNTPLIVEYYSRAVIDPLSNTGFGNTLRKIVFLGTIPLSEEKTAEALESYSWKANIDENSRNEYLGVEIKNFEPDLRIINTNTIGEDKKISASAYISAYSLEPINIRISCWTENGKLGEAEPEYILVDPELKSSFTVVCSYDLNSFEIDRNDAGDTQKIKIAAEYDFLTEGYIPIYTLSEGSLNQDEIEEFFKSIGDKNIDAETKIPTGTYTRGPMKLILRSYYNQPINEGNNYLLNLRVDDIGTATTGTLKEIREIDILTVPEIRIESDELGDYIESEDGLEKYRFSHEKLLELNNICKDKKNLLKEDCWRRGEIMTTIEYSVASAGEEIEEAPIRAKVKYIYQDEKQTSITFINTE